MLGSTIKLHQISIPELSGYITLFLNNGNTSGYITGFNSGLYALNSNTGNFITTGQTGSFVSFPYFNSSLLSLALQNSLLYYSNNNPSGFINGDYLTNYLSGYNPFINGDLSFYGKDGVYISGSGQSIFIGQTGLSSGLLNNNLNFGSGSLSLVGLNGITISNSGDTVFINQTTNLSPNFSLTGFLNLSGINGIKVLLDTHDNILISGIDTGNFITSSQTGNYLNLFYPLNLNPNGYLTSVNTGNFVSTSQLNSTGSYLYNLINNDVISINNKHGNLLITGSGNISVINLGQVLVISGSTGVYSGFLHKNSNPVFTTGNQIISGSKTFKDYTYFSKAFYVESGNAGMDFSTFTLVDQTEGNIALNWDNRTLNNKTEITTLDWQKRILSGSWTGQNLFVSGARVITTNDTGNFGNAVNTGVLTGIFYPRYSNPSGYITTGQTGVFGNAINTGVLTGVFYPFKTNPSGYITTGQTGAFGGLTNTGILTGVFYPLNSNPSGYITSNTQTGSYIFSSTAISGVTKQFISFPNFLGNNPYVIPSLSNISGGEGIIAQASGISSSGYWAQYSNTIDNNGYVLTTLASISNNTGFSTTLIQQNIPSTWTNLTDSTTVIWNAQTNVVEDHKILILTGNTTLNISGLYNGWCGILQTIQSGISSTGYNLTLPAITKVSNNGVNHIYLTNVSGAIDMIAFVYDGTKLLASVGYYFS